MKEIKRNDMNEMTCCKDAAKIVQEKKESECRHGNHGNFSHGWWSLSLLRK